MFLGMHKFPKQGTRRNYLKGNDSQAWLSLHQKIPLKVGKGDEGNIWNAGI